MVVDPVYGSEPHNVKIIVLVVVAVAAATVR
jgi:hypothetical protein